MDKTDRDKEFPALKGIATTLLKTYASLFPSLP